MWKRCFWIGRESVILKKVKSYPLKIWYFCSTPSGIAVKPLKTKTCRWQVLCYVHLIGWVFYKENFGIAIADTRAGIIH